MSSLSELYGRLEPDPMRASLGWSEAFAAAQAELLAAKSDPDRTRILEAWLSVHQPCLFGKLAAKRDMVEICFLSEDDICSSDEHVYKRIHEAHERWWASSMDGFKSGFIVLAASERLAAARPNAALLEFSQRLLALYLDLDEVRCDSVYLDEVFLEIPVRGSAQIYRWLAGVNVFSSAGERRWWQDHRIPGGLGFSVNSVGHMVKSASMTQALDQFYQSLGIEVDDGGPDTVNSLGKALRMAMTTIANASPAVSGPATWLIDDAEAGEDECGTPPVDLGRNLEGKSHCSYRGTYHTDHTLPSAYFRDDVVRPHEVEAMKLDFTYLFLDSPENPAFKTMGAGKRIRGDERDDHRELTKPKSHRWIATTVDPAKDETVARILALRIQQRRS